MLKKILIILIPISIIGIISTVLIYNNKKTNSTEQRTNKTKKIKKEKQEQCIPFTGGSFIIIFNTDSENKIDNMSVCIACSPDSYKDLPTPSKEGYTFDGWYYDKELTKKVESKNTKDIKPIPKKEKDCIVGYEDINLYAKYTKIENRVEEKGQQANQTQAPIPQQTPPTNVQTRTYQTSFKRPIGTITLFTDGGSFGPKQTTRPYLAITSATPVVIALADGEIITISGINNDIGGLIITKQTLYLRNEGIIKDYLIVLNHITYTNLKIGNTFTGGQNIGLSATGIHHGLSERTRRYSIYAYNIYNEELKNRLRACPTYACITSIITSIDQYRINILDKIEK